RVRCPGGLGPDRLLASPVHPGAWTCPGVCPGNAAGPSLATRSPWMHAFSTATPHSSMVRLAGRKVGRERVLLSSKPALVEEIDALRAAAARALSAVLGGEVQLTAAMADAPVPASRALGRTAVFSILALGGSSTDAVLELEPRFVSELGAR